MFKQNHIENIDFIKGLAAISVILLHTLPKKILYGSFAVYHIWQAVPIFLFITFYLGFSSFEKTGNILKGYYSKERVKKVFQKLWIPFLIIALLEAIYFLVIGDKVRLIGSLLCISNGPGCYYIWVYMQIWVLLPLIYTLLTKCGNLMGGGILLIISVLGDFIVEKYISFPPAFFCFRYLFLSVPAYMYLKGVNIKNKWFLILFSGVYLYLMNYTVVSNRFDPILPDGWEAQTSLSFFYTFFLFYLLYRYYDRLRIYKMIQKFITHIGSISWEVFIIQMLLLGSGVISYLSSMLYQSFSLQIGFKVIATLLVSLFFAELLKKLMDAIISKMY